MKHFYICFCCLCPVVQSPLLLSFMTISLVSCISFAVALLFWFVAKKLWKKYRDVPKKTESTSVELSGWIKNRSRRENSSDRPRATSTDSVMSIIMNPLWNQRSGRADSQREDSQAEEFQMSTADHSRNEPGCSNAHSPDDATASSVRLAKLSKLHSFQRRGIEVAIISKEAQNSSSPEVANFKGDTE
jgi:hypothetical protein